MPSEKDAWRFGEELAKVGSSSSSGDAFRPMKNEKFWSNLH